MVEGELWHFRNRKPSGIGGIGGGFCFVRRQFNERVIGDAHHAFARIAFRGSDPQQLIAPAASAGHRTTASIIAGQDHPAGMDVFFDQAAGCRECRYET